MKRTIHAAIFAASAAFLIGAATTAGAAEQGRRFNVGDVVDADTLILKILECRMTPGVGEECRVQNWEGGGPSGQQLWMPVRDIEAAIDRLESRTGRSAFVSRAAPAAAAAPSARNNGGVRAPARVLGGNARTAPVAPVAGGGRCAPLRYGGPVPGSARASEALFRQKIADNYTMQATSTFQIGVTFEQFSVGSPVRNTVSNQPGVGAVRVNEGAPVGAMMYPIVSRHVVCEVAGSNVERRRIESDYYCFVSKEKEWICATGGSGRPPRITPL
jgi:hypothetical protein